MFEMLLADESFFSKYGLLIILVVLLVGMFVWNYFRQKKAIQQEEEMQRAITVGTKVKTYAGVYGTVVNIYETTDGRVAVLSLDGKSTMEVDFRSLYAIDSKKMVDEEPEQVVEEPAKTVENVVVEKTPSKVEEVKEEPKKAEKKSKSSK